MNFWGTPVQIVTMPTSPVDNDRSTLETIHQMIAIAGVCARDQRIHAIADNLIRSLPNKPTETDLARAIFWWIKNRVEFREDESILSREMGYSDPNQELLISPIALLAMPQPQGDCDDFSMLVATLCLATGIHCWYVTVAVDEESPNRWSHVYVQAMVDGHRITLDASHGSCPGWETRRTKYRRAEWFVG